jgi:uncharacterized membrane protein
MLWTKALHLIFMVTWFAGLFYLPRLFVYHAIASDTVSIDRFKIMERKLYWGITTPGGVLDPGPEWLVALRGNLMAGGKTGASGVTRWLSHLLRSLAAGIQA